MSLYNYQKSIKVVAQDYPFYALIMAAIHQASGFELEKLKEAFPALYYEVAERNSVDRGLLEEDGR